ncbi:MAG: HD domain-containing phosphohydrolase [Rubrobacter sp.]
MRAICFLTSLAMARVGEHRKKGLRLEAENAALKDALRESNAEIAFRLVGRLGSRDGYAASHAAASTVYARDVAREMGLGEDRSQDVRLAALLMDVGLLWVPDEVLLTHPEKINSVGKMRLEGHPKDSEEVLLAVPGFGEASRWVRWHHERPDGTGYPDRLPGEWIPTEAKILAASSFYASMVLAAPHTRGISAHEARRALVHGMGKAVDDEVVTAFLRVLDGEGPDYASASDARFSFSPHDRAANALSTT